MLEAGKEKSNNKDFQFWQQHNHPIELSSKEFVYQRLDYIYNNLVELGLIENPRDWVYSSARDYEDEKGLIDIYFLYERYGLSETLRPEGGVRLVFGEIGMDLDLNARGYKSLQPRIDDIDAPNHNGIDGVYEKDGLYFIVEGKYSGSSSLNSASGSLPRQMSDAWIQRPGELEKAVGDLDLAEEIVDSGYVRVLAKVALDGSVTYKTIDSNGFVSGDFNP